MSKKKTIEDCQKLASERGGKCLSTEYIDNTSIMIWECEHGHQWPAMRRDIQQGYWCPDCGGTKKKTIEDCHNLAKLNNGKFLSPIYINARSEYKWECERGHVFPMKYSEVKSGHWCAPCRKGKYRKKGGRRPFTLNDCHKLAEERGGRCLSIEYINRGTHLIWECGDCGHIWPATFAGVKGMGSWCPKCAKKKRIDTNMKRYGFPIALQNPDIARKNARSNAKNTTAYHWKTGEEIICRSSWEEKVIARFNEEQKNFFWEPKSFIMPNGKTYTPDCYLPDEDLWIEIKGRKFKKNMEKWLWFHKEYPNSELWDKDFLKSFNIL